MLVCDKLHFFWNENFPMVVAGCKHYPVVILLKAFNPKRALEQDKKLTLPSTASNHRFMASSNSWRVPVSIMRLSRRWILVPDSSSRRPG